jgi:hypothetical protein
MASNGWTGSRFTGLAMAARVLRGPSLPGATKRHVSFTTADGAEDRISVDRDGPQVLDTVRVRVGANSVQIRALDQPTARSSRDPRPLLVGLEGLDVSMSTTPVVSASCSVSLIDGWYNPEQTAGGWLRWSNGHGRLRLLAQHSGSLELDGEVLSLAKPNVVSVSVDGRQVASWPIDDPAWAFHEFAPIRIPIMAGRATVVEFTSRQAAQAQATDPRKLALALKNLVFKSTDSTGACGGLTAGQR